MTKPSHRLEWQSILLAASWRYNFGESIELHAFIEESELDVLSRDSVEKLEKLNVDIRTINNDGLFESRYPHGNKIIVCNQEFSTDRVIFCDSDMYIHKSFELNDLCLGVVSSVPAGRRTWGAKEDESWDYLYKNYLGLAVPDNIILENNQKSPPYYNAGLISFDNQSNFAKNWFELALLIDRDKKVINKRPWLDQIALPVAIKKTCMETERAFYELDKAYNCTPSFESKGFSTPFIIHYHGDKRIFENKLNHEISKQLRETNVCTNFVSLTKPIHERINS